MAAAGDALAQMVADVASQAGRLGLEVSDVAGAVDAVSARVKAQAEAFAGLAADADGMIAANREAADAARSAHKVAEEAHPPQVTTHFTALTDRLLPPILEAALGLDPSVAFCAAVDRNGHLPTHNKRISQPQGADPVWNAANCRNRRIFDDRVGLGAGRNTKPFLLQSYRRDMGGGVFVAMKDVSAPITVRGRHWGGLRLAYKA